MRSDLSALAVLARAVGLDDHADELERAVLDLRDAGRGIPVRAAVWLVDPTADGSPLDELYTAGEALRHTHALGSRYYLAGDAMIDGIGRIRDAARNLQWVAA